MKIKVTIQDILEEHELELFGIRESIDGAPVNSSLKISEFLCESGIYEATGYKEIQDRYRGKLKDRDKE